MFIFVTCWNELVEETEEFVDLYFWKVGIVGGIFYFKSIAMLAFSGHHVWERVEARVTDWNADCVVPFFLQKFNQNSFAVKAPFAPTPKFDAVNFSCHFIRLLNMVYLLGFRDKNCSLGRFKKCVWGMLLYSLI